MKKRKFAAKNLTGYIIKILVGFIAGILISLIMFNYRIGWFKVNLGCLK